MRVTPREVIEAHQYIYPSSTQQIAHALGGMVDRKGNLWLELDDGVQTIPVGCWIICRSNRPERILSRAEVQAEFVPVDWQEALQMLGGTSWSGDPEPSRTLIQTGYEHPKV